VFWTPYFALTILTSIPALGLKTQGRWEFMLCRQFFDLLQMRVEKRATDDQRGRKGLDVCYSGTGVSVSTGST